MTKIPFRPLGLVKELLEKTGLDVSHQWEDLVFVSHNAFILRMGDEGKDIFVYFNTESEENKREEMIKGLIAEGSAMGFEVVVAGTYSLIPKEDNTIDIQFFDEVTN